MVGYGGPFSAGTIEVPLNNDYWFEDAETFSIDLSGAEIILASSSATVTIDDNDDDKPIVTVPTSVSVVEDVSGGEVDVFVSLSNPSLFPVTVQYTTQVSALTPLATDSQDYTATEGPLTFPAADPASDPATFSGAGLTLAVPIAVLDDTPWHAPAPLSITNQPWAPEEYFAFRISDPVNARLEGMYGYGGNAIADVEIIDEQSFPNLTVTPTTGANEVTEGGTIDLNFSFDQVFETTEVLNYSVYWDFDAAEYDYWQWHGGQQGPWNGNVCDTGYHWLPPTEHGELLADGSITLTPGGSHNFIRTIGAPPPNNLRDPYRFVRIVFSWENDDYSNGYYDPSEHIVPIVDDHLDPTLSLAVQPATIYENPDEGPNSAIGVVTLSHGWSVPHRADIQGGQSASGNSDDLEIFGPAFFEPGETAGPFDVRAVHDEATEGDESVTITATASWMTASATADVTIIDTSVLPSQPAPKVVPSWGTFEIPSDLQSGDIVIGLDTVGAVQNDWLSDGPFSYDYTSGTVYFDGTAALIPGQSYDFRFGSTANSSWPQDPLSTYTLNVVVGDLPPVLLGQTQFEVSAGAGELATVGWIAANDPDGDAVSYMIDDPTGSLPFVIDEQTGLVQTTSSFSAAAGSTFTMDLGFGAVTVNVTDPDRTHNFAPIAIPDQEATSAGQTVFIDVAGNDFDPEAEVTNQLQILDGPVNGTAVVATVNGITGIQFTPNAGFLGSETFTYTVTDAAGQSGVGRVSINVSDPTGAVTGHVLVLMTPETAFDAQPYMVDGNFSTNYPATFAIAPTEYHGGLRAALDRLENFGFTWEAIGDLNAVHPSSYDAVVDVGHTIPGILQTSPEVLIAPSRIGTAIYSTAARDSVIANVVHTRYPSPAFPGGGRSNMGPVSVSLFSPQPPPLLTDVDYLYPPSYYQLGGGVPLVKGNFQTGCDSFDLRPIVVSTGTETDGSVIAAGSSMFSRQGLFGEEPVDQYFRFNDMGQLWDNTIQWLADPNTGPGSDNDPVLVSTEFINLSLPVYTQSGALVGDLSDDPSISYIPVSPTPSVFAFDASSQQIHLVDASLLQVGARYDMTFDVAQSGIVTHQAIVTVVVTAPNRAPTIQLPAGPFGIFENSLSGTFVGQIIATDPDSGTVLDWQVTAGNSTDDGSFTDVFAIDDSGNITVSNSAGLDYELDSSFTLDLVVTDDVPWNPLSDTVSVTIDLTDIVIEIDASGIHSVVENSAMGVSAGTLLPKDWTGTGPLDYSVGSVVDGNGNVLLASDFDVLELDATTGNLVIDNEALLDFEFLSPNNWFDLHINVTDTSSGDTGFGPVRVIVDDGNEKPTLQLTNVTSTLGEHTSTVGRVKVADIEILDDALQGINGNQITITSANDDHHDFVVVEVTPNQAWELYIEAGTSLNFEFRDTYEMTISR